MPIQRPCPDLFSVTVIGFGLLVAGSMAADAPAGEKITYQDHVRPLLENKCFSCHNPDKKKGDLDMTSFAALMAGGGGGAIVDPGNVGGSRIISTTTNGTRALRACVTGKSVAVASFLNLSATADWLEQQPTPHVILVCAGTAEFPALEDILGAGALCELLVSKGGRVELLDSAETAARVYREARRDLFGVISRSQNGQRLMANSDLCDDVEYCLRRDACGLVALLGADGMVRRSG